MADDISTELELSMMASSIFPGFRFSPTDDELLTFYLKKKLEGGNEKSLQVIGEVEIYMFEPWDLPAKSVLQSDNEWFFFSPRGRKYPNGNQTRRGTDLGYWKATGKERNVKAGCDIIGTKRTLVFHIGRAPKGDRTEWIMHEYTMKEKSQDYLVLCRLRRTGDIRHYNTSNQASSSQRHLSPLQNEHGIVSEVGEASKEKEADIALKKYNYSSDTPSGERMSIASESNKKDAAEPALVESADYQQDYPIQDYGDDDFYNDILNDDIINLDETAPFGASDPLPMIFPSSEIGSKSEQDQASTMEWEPNQGSANRRMRLKKRVPRDSGAEKSDKMMVEKANPSNVELWGTWLMSILSSVTTAHACDVRVVIIVLFVLLALFFSIYLVFGVPKAVH